MEYQHSSGPYLKITVLWSISVTEEGSNTLLGHLISLIQCRRSSTSIVCYVVVVITIAVLANYSICQ